jgi:hypothetical protein
MTLNELRDATKEQILERLGLTAKPDFFDYLLPAAGIFAAGILLGAGLGLMMAPKPGAELREDLAARYADAVRSLRSQLGNEREAGPSQSVTRA